MASTSGLPGSTKRGHSVSRRRLGGVSNEEVVVIDSLPVSVVCVHVVVHGRSVFEEGVARRALKRLRGTAVHVFQVSAGVAEPLYHLAAQQAHKTV